MEPGIRTRLTNLLAMVAAPEKYDKNVKLKFPFEFYLKKTLEFVKNIKVTAPAIVEALSNSGPNDIVLIQNILNTQQGQTQVPIDPLLLSAIGTYANECADEIIKTQQDTACYEIGGSQYESNITSFYEDSINALNHASIPYIASNASPRVYIPINQCYNNVLCASFDVSIVVPNFGTYVIHFTMFIKQTTIDLVATKSALLPN